MPAMQVFAGLTAPLVGEKQHTSLVSSTGMDECTDLKNVFCTMPAMQVSPLDSIVPGGSTDGPKPGRNDGCIDFSKTTPFYCSYTCIVCWEHVTCVSWHDNSLSVCKACQKCCSDFVERHRMDINVLDLVYDIVRNTSLVNSLVKRLDGHGGWFRVEEVYERMGLAAEHWEIHSAEFYEALQNWTGLGVVEVATATKTLCLHELDDDDDDVIKWIRMVEGDIDIGG